MPPSVEPAWAAPARRRAGPWALVLLAHVGLWLAWQTGLHRLPLALPTFPAAPAWVWLRPTPVTDPPVARRPSAAAPVPAPVQALPRRVAPAPGLQRTAPAMLTPPPQAPASPPEAARPSPDPGAPPEATRPEATSSLRLLDNEASRAALRDLTRQPLLSERAATATGLPLRSGAQRRAEAASAAGKGDCGKGEFAGGGAGLLSLPFLAAAVARGDCAR